MYFGYEFSPFRIQTLTWFQPWYLRVFSVVLSLICAFVQWLKSFWSQVTVEYTTDHGAVKPLRVHTVVISAQHDETVTLEQLRSDLMEHVVRPVIPAQYLDDNTVFHIQPSGRFIIGGPQVRCSLNSLNFMVWRVWRSSLHRWSKQLLKKSICTVYFVLVLSSCIS